MVDKWIKHNGEGMPVNGSTFVHVKFADGVKVSSNIRADYWEWDWNRPKPDMIVAYRVVTP